MAEETIRVTDLPQFVKKCAAASAECEEFLRTGLLAIAEPVAKDIRALYEGKSMVGAEGIVSKVAKTGTAMVVQTKRKGRGKRQRPNFGPLMYSDAFLPGLVKNESTAQAAVDSLFDQIDENWSA